MSGDRWGSGGPGDHSTYAPIAAPTPQPDAETAGAGDDSLDSPNEGNRP